MSFDDFSCKKCAWEGKPFIHYQGATYAYGHEIFGEHLKVSCCQCGYSKQFECLDKNTRVEARDPITSRIDADVLAQIERATRAHGCS